MPILNGITNLVKLGEMAVKTEPADGRTVHLQALLLCAAAAGADRRVPQALRRRHLSDGEGAVMATLVTLRTALGKSPLVRALKEGTVASDRVALRLRRGRSGHPRLPPHDARDGIRPVRDRADDPCAGARLWQADHRAAGRAVARSASRRADLPARFAVAWPGRPGRQAHRRARLVADHRRLGARHPAGRVRHRTRLDDLGHRGRRPRAGVRRSAVRAAHRGRVRTCARCCCPARSMPRSRWPVSIPLRSAR